MTVTMASTRKASSRMANAGVDTGAKMLGVTGGRRSTRLPLDASCRSSVPVPRAGRRCTFLVVRFSARTRNQPTGRSLAERTRSLSGYRGFRGGTRLRRGAPNVGGLGAISGPPISLHLAQRPVDELNAHRAFAHRRRDPL